MTSKRTVIALSLIAVLGIFVIASAQPQNQPLLFHTLTTNYDPIPIEFNNVPAQDGWLIYVVCAGGDHINQPPVMGIGVGNVGLPTGDDFLADPVQNNVQSLFVNGLEQWGPGYEGCLYSLQAVNCLQVGTGTEDVINVGDYIYLRAFNATNRLSATMYADMTTPMLVTLTSPGFPVDVYGIDITPDFPLPVELLSFTANPGNNFVGLEWVTASETENHHFNIYRDEVKITEVGTKAIGNQSSEPLTYNFKDNQVTNGVQYSYQLTAVDINGVESEIISEVESVTPAWDPDYIVTEYNLHQNYPNPFNPGTTIEFDVLESGNVYLSVFNIQGQEVAKLVDGEYRVGPLKHVTFWNAEALSSGIYFYQVRVNDFKATKKMALVR